MSEPAERQYDSLRLGAGAGPRRDAVAVEEPMEVRVNGAPFAVVMRTPGADRDLAAGFLLAEDVVHGADEIGLIEYCLDAEDEGRGNVLNVLAYVPLGIIGSGLGWSAGVVALTGASASGITETLQLFSTRRYPSATDFLLNSAGTLIGIALAGGRRTAAGTARRPDEAH